MQGNKHLILAESEIWKSLTETLFINLMTGSREGIELRFLSSTGPHLCCFTSDKIRQIQSSLRHPEVSYWHAPGRNGEPK